MYKNFRIYVTETGTFVVKADSKRFGIKVKKALRRLDRPAIMRLRSVASPTVKTQSIANIII